MAFSLDISIVSAQFPLPSFSSTGQVDDQAMTVSPMTVLLPSSPAQTNVEDYRRIVHELFHVNEKASDLIGTGQFESRLAEEFVADVFSYCVVRERVTSSMESALLDEVISKTDNATDIALFEFAASALETLRSGKAESLPSSQQAMLYFALPKVMISLALREAKISEAGEKFRQLEDSCVEFEEAGFPSTLDLARWLEG